VNCLLLFLESARVGLAEFERWRRCSFSVLSMVSRHRKPTVHRIGKGVVSCRHIGSVALVPYKSSRVSKKRFRL
jgi:hypothetical protein